MWTKADEVMFKFLKKGYYFYKVGENELKVYDTVVTVRGALESSVIRIVVNGQEKEICITDFVNAVFTMAHYDDVITLLKEMLGDRYEDLEKYSAWIWVYPKGDTATVKVAFGGERYYIIFTFEWSEAGIKNIARTASIYGEVDDIFNIWEIIESMEVVEDE